jgi:hypothetical protein
MSKYNNSGYTETKKIHGWFELSIDEESELVVKKRKEYSSYALNTPHVLVVY